MQQALVQSGKMAALGELSAGIAHELNQPLQAIKGYAQELNAQGSSPFLKEIITGADKMAAIIKHLREFIRNSIESHELMDLRQPIEDALKLMTMEFKNNGIEVVKKIPADLPKIYGNPLSIEQVIINLATNARDAIIATHRGSGIIAIELKVAGQFVEILFSDNGTGMTEQTRKKAFDPFFTTKSVGKGMGLGLSLSFGMIEKVNGSIMIESEIGKGTVFKIRIPRDFREENL
jgi:C4-dicarboxylate-specific signal transduction histidine kinase